MSDFWKDYEPEPHKGLSDHLAQATNGRVHVDPVTGNVGIGTPAAPVQEPVAGQPLPCPFCGHIGLDFSDGETYRWGVASCGGCGASCGDVRREYPDQGEWHTEAIAEWNRRSPAAQRPDVDALVALARADERNRTWTQEHWTEYERSIAAAEREACLSVIKPNATPMEIAAAIRARSCPPCNEDCDQGRNCPARGKT